MKTNVHKWGNSLGVRIPKSAAQKLCLRSGSPVQIVVNDDCITIYPEKYVLADMVKSITRKNMHSNQWSDQDKRGNEEW